MGEHENRQTVERLIQALNERDLDLFHAQFQEDAVIEYPQSGERIVGGDNRRGVYNAFPGLPTVTPTRIRVSGDLAVVEAAMDYGDGTDYRSVIVFELRDGKIVHEAGYWTQPFEAADWRSEWVERTDD